MIRHSVRVALIVAATLFVSSTFPTAAPAQTVSFVARKDFPLGSPTSVALGDFSVTALKAQHDPERMCLNYLVSRGGKTLLYATDTGVYQEPTWKFLAGFHLDGVVMEPAMSDADVAAEIPA